MSSPQNLLNEKMLVRLKLDPSLIERKDLELIDDVFCKNLTNSELKKLDLRLHELFREIGKVTEPLHNAHVFVWLEMRKRGISHEIEDELTEETALEVVEYPIPEGLNEESWKESISLKRILLALPERILIKDFPAHVHLCGRVVNEGIVPPGHDVDILFKQRFPDKRIIKEFIEAIRQKDPVIADRLHFVFDPHGPQVGYSIPIYRQSFSRLPPSEIVRHSPWEYLTTTKAKPFKPFISLKAKAGFGTFEFYDPEELYKVWVAPRLSKGIFIQKKYDGRRFQIHYAKGKIKIITEDRQRDRSEVFPEAVKEFKEKFKIDSVILDTECVQYDCRGKEVKDKEAICDYIEREKSGWMTVGKRKPEMERDIVFHIHDILYLNGKPVNNLPYRERWEILNKIVPPRLEHFRIVKSAYVETPKEFFKEFNRIIHLPSSEGAMLKTSDSLYRIKYSGENRTSDWAKFKNLKDIDVLVWSSIEKRRKETGKGLGNYMYWTAFRIPCKMLDKFPKLVEKKNKWGEIIPNVGGAFEYQGKCYSIIGRTYATKTKCKRGDVITVRTVRIRKFEKDGKILYTWMFPIFGEKRSKDKPVDTLTKIERLVKVGSGPIDKKTLVKLSIEELTDKELKKAIQEPIIIDLKVCPFWNDSQICPLKNRFAHPMDYLVKKAYLRFPIACPFAEYFRCRYVKKYYYQVKDVGGEEE